MTTPNTDATATQTPEPQAACIAGADLRALIADALAGLVDFRHGLHAHPEIRYEEVRTSAKVREALAEREIEFVGDLAGGTGVLAAINGADSTTALGLRADMDALPIFEESGLEYASKFEGKMHACGHDGHTTILIGAARVLKKIADTQGLPRSIKFVFQPAEEGGAGGKRMVEDGVLTNEVLGPPVERMYGLHCWPLLGQGYVSTKEGPLLAAADMFQLKIRGQGAHAAFPHYSHDPVIAGAQIVIALQTFVSRNLDPLDSAVISVTTFNAGSATNIIAEHAQLSGTLRTLSTTTRELAKQRIEEIALNTALAHQCSIELNWEGDGYPVTENHPDAVADVFRYGQAAVGENKMLEWPTPVMGGEDFSFYCQQVPSCFFLLGQQPPTATEPYPSVHTPVFNFNDDTIALGVEMFCRIALNMD